MGVGPNYVLNKGLKATGATAFAFGEFVVATTDGTTCARATTAGAAVVYVCQESVDAARIATGGAFVNVAMLGIVRVLAGGAVAVNAKVTNDTNARAVTAGAAGTPAAGIALTASTAAGQYIDVLLTPGNTV